ncbi:hypothetical protein BJX64DRAFT_221714 [Aspergillus heterothallicus]
MSGIHLHFQLSPQRPLFIFALLTAAFFPAHFACLGERTTPSRPVLNRCTLLRYPPCVVHRQIHIAFS